VRGVIGMSNKDTINRYILEGIKDGKLDTAHNYLYEPSFAIPYSGLGIAYFYNKDIYEKLGLNVPKTWDEFMSNCQVIKE
jgi:ABC-type glycerol-3-phosphate transport system substrate-binding protein